MRKLVPLCCLAALLLTGCHEAYENPYKVDTVVRIPVDPVVEMTATAAPETEPEATEASQKTTSSGKSSGTSSNKTSSGKTTSTTKATEPPATEPPATEPPTEAPTQPPFVPSEYTPGALEREMLDLINAQRTAAGLEELILESSLCEMAAVRSCELASLWSHTRPDGRGFETVLEDQGFLYTQAAENVIHGSGDPEAAVLVESWMNSDSHRANILSAEFVLVGIGLYETNGISYITVLFVG